MDQAQQAVASIWVMVTKAREWIANVSDVVYPGSDPRKMNGGSAASMADLQRLLSEANSLNVTVSETAEVARIIHAAVEWQHKVDDLLGTLQAPVRGRAGRASVQLSTLCSVLEEAELIPVHLDQRLQLQERVQSKIQVGVRSVLLGPIFLYLSCLECRAFPRPPSSRYAFLQMGND